MITVGTHIAATPTDVTRHLPGWWGTVQKIYTAGDGREYMEITTTSCRIVHLPLGTTDWEIAEDVIADVDPASISVGTCVQTTRHGYRGVVHELSNTANQGFAWLHAQQPPIHPSALNDPGYPWVSILVDGNGSVSVPLYDVQVIENFDVTNRYLSNYFTRAQDGAYQPV